MGIKNIFNKIVSIIEDVDSELNSDNKTGESVGLSSNNLAPREPMLTQNGNIEISSIEDMTCFLEELQEHASDSVESAIKAQLHVIRFIQSPTLVDTTLDTLILNLKNSLDLSESKSETIKLKSQFSLMIQNYIFFLDARLQSEINDNQKESQKLLEEAGTMLSKSVVDVAELYVTAGTSSLKKFAGRVIVKNVFAINENQNQKQNIIGRLIGFWNKEKNTAKKKDDFYKTLFNTIKKLDKYSDYIGTSLLINGMIERYSSDITQHAFSADFEEIDNNIQYNLREMEDFPILFSKAGVTISVFVVGMVTILVRWIWYGLASAGSFVVSKISETEIISDHTGWFLPHFAWVMGITILVELICAIISFVNRKRISESLAYYYSLREQKEQEAKEFEENLLNIAEKFSVL